MKLYATVQSERATKGQGGETLEIVITGENKETLFELDAKKVGDQYIIDGYAISYHSKNASLRSESYYRYELKGNQQKAD